MYANDAMLEYNFVTNVCSQDYNTHYIWNMIYLRASMKQTSERNPSLSEESSTNSSVSSSDEVSRKLLRMTSSFAIPLNCLQTT